MSPVPGPLLSLLFWEALWTGLVATELLVTVLDVLATSVDAWVPDLRRGPLAAVLLAAALLTRQIGTPVKALLLVLERDPTRCLLTQRTGELMLSFLAAVLLNLLVALILWRGYGLLGAAAGSLMSAVCLCALLWWRGRTLTRESSRPEVDLSEQPA